MARLLWGREVYRVAHGASKGWSNDPSPSISVIAGRLNRPGMRQVCIIFLINKGHGALGKGSKSPVNIFSRSTVGSLVV